MMCLIGIFPAKGVSQTLDSLSTIEMKEVVVKARMHRTDASSSIFTPTARQKTSAQNAIDLLKQLAIPQININLMDNTVTTPSGQGVDIYINYIPASAEEMEGISTSDVRRVEYLDFPADPRFQGKEHVVNFIVQQYEYGGYTKATLNENFLIGKLSSRASVYSKFVHKRMTYDLYAGASNHDISHSGNSVSGIYSLQNEAGEAYQMNRNETLESSRLKYNQYPVTFRAIYDTDKMQIANTVGFNFDQTPLSETKGILSFVPQQNTDYSYYKNEPSTSRYFVWSGNYYFILPHDFDLSVSPGMNYGHTNYSYLYQTSLPGSSRIANISREDVWQFRGSATLFKKIADKQSAFFRAWFGSTSNNVNYSGTSPYDNDFSDTYAGAALGYNFSNARWNVRADAALQWEKNQINDQSVAEVYPLLNLSAGFSPSQKHSFRTFFHFGATTPGPVKKHRMFFSRTS